MRGEDMQGYRTAVEVGDRIFRSPWYDNPNSAAEWSLLVLEATRICGGPKGRVIGGVETRDKGPEYMRCQDGSIARVEELPTGGNDV
jgi:hypothetical protein